MKGLAERRTSSEVGAAKDGARGRGEARKNLQHAVEAGFAGRRCREGEAGAVRREAASGGGAVAWGRRRGSDGKYGRETLILSVQQNEWTGGYRRAGKERRGAKNFSAWAESLRIHQFFRSANSCQTILPYMWAVGRYSVRGMDRLILVRIISNSIIIYSIDR